MYKENWILQFSSSDLLNTQKCHAIIEFWLIFFYLFIARACLNCLSIILEVTNLEVIYVRITFLFFYFVATNDNQENRMTRFVKIYKFVTIHKCINSQGIFRIRHIIEVNMSSFSIFLSEMTTTECY